MDENVLLKAEIDNIINRDDKMLNSGENIGIDNKISMLKEKFRHDSYNYSDINENFSHINNLHFKTKEPKKMYGVYIIRRQDTREILYIGKAGTITQNGEFLGQDLSERIPNVHDPKRYRTGNEWYRKLVLEKGAIIIEYIILPLSHSPAFVEAYLLQEFINDFGCLPYRNNEL